MFNIHYFMILCLHGYRQNGTTFRERTGAFRKIIKHHAELVFISAPNITPPEKSKAGNKSEEKPEDIPQDVCGWWFSRENNSYKPEERTHCCKGYDASLDVIKKAFLELGPFDGVFAFSQGACMLTLLCSLREKNPDWFRFNFAIFVAGFRSKSTAHDHLYETTVTIPTLHVFGDTDKVIPKAMSEDILPLYIEPMTLQHPGGHFVPASAPQKKLYIDFLDKMLAIKS